MFTWTLHADSHFVCVFKAVILLTFGRLWLIVNSSFLLIHSFLLSRLTDRVKQMFLNMFYNLGLRIYLKEQTVPNPRLMVTVVGPVCM